MVVLVLLLSSFSAASITAAAIFCTWVAALLLFYRFREFVPEICFTELASRGALLLKVLTRWFYCNSLIRSLPLVFMEALGPFLVYSSASIKRGSVDSDSECLQLLIFAGGFVLNYWPVFMETWEPRDPLVPFWMLFLMRGWKLSSCSWVCCV